MRRLVPLAALAFLGLAGCAGGLLDTPRANDFAERGTSVSADLEFFSDVSDPYWVLSGPAQSYKAFPVNGTLERLLRERLKGDAARAAALDGRVRVKVHLQSVDTGMRVLGAAEHPMPDRHARWAASGSVATVSFGEGLLDRDLGEAANIPEEVRKWVILRGEVEVVRDQALLVRRPFEVEQRRVVLRWDYDQWAYDYSEVMRAALEATAGRVEEILAESLSAGA